MSAVILIFAYIWDQILGDPQHWPHPVRFIGRWIQFADSAWNKAEFSAKFRLRMGMVLCYGSVLGVFALVDGVLILSNYIHPLLTTVIAIVLLGVALATHDLPRAVLEIESLLLSGDLEKARDKLSWIVGRDTHKLDPSQIRRAALETLAENWTDAVLSPLFWFVLLGPAGTWALKTASTLDSMVGYQNERYREFGRASAKLDDWMHWIPARLGAWLIIPLAALISGLGIGNCLQCVKSDRLKHPSPNSAHSESAFAGALGLRLGGQSTYMGKTSMKPYLNEKGRSSYTSQDMQRALGLFKISTLLALLLCAALLWTWGVWF